MLPPLVTFQSYRKLLEVVLQEEKKHFATPHKNLADSLGLTASHLSMILDGKRNLSFNNIRKLSLKLKCSDAEFEVLEALLLRDNSKDPDETSHYQAKLDKLKVHNAVKTVRAASLPKISDWHILPLFVFITDFVKATNVDEIFLQCKGLCTKFHITEEQLQLDLQLLSTLGVLNFSESDKVHLRFDKLSGEFSQIRFMQSLVNKALESIPTHFARADAHFSAEAITLSEVQSRRFYQRYKELIAEFVAQDRDMTSLQDVIMISLQMVPLEL